MTGDAVRSTSRASQVVSRAMDVVAPMTSQLSFSVASVLATAGVSRSGGAHLYAAVAGAYSLESIAISWIQNRYVQFAFLRGPSSWSRGDVLRILGGSAGVLVAAAPVFAGSAWIATHDIRLALTAGAWSAAMGLADAARFAASRALAPKSLLLSSLGMLALFVGVTMTIRGSLGNYLVGTSLVALAVALGNLVLLVRRRSGDVSSFWNSDAVFGRNLGVEGLVSAAAMGLAGAVLSWRNVEVATATQMGNQILAMPVNVLIVSASLPLTRRLVGVMESGGYPVRRVVQWIALNCGVLAVAVAFLYVAKPLVLLLFGAPVEIAYRFMPFLIASVLTISIWYPVTTAERWVAGPRSVRRVITGINAALFAGDVVIALLAPTHIVWWLTGWASLVALTMTIRCTRWLMTGAERVARGALALQP